MEEKKEEMKTESPAAPAVATPEPTQENATEAPKKKSFMRRLLKGLLWTVCGILLFVVVALLALPLWINPVGTSLANSIVPWCTGTEFKLEQLKLNPYTGKLAVSGLRLGNPAGFAEKDAAALGLLSVDIDPSSLLSKTIHVRDVTVEAPFASYVFDKDGTNNFDRILAEVERKLKLKKEKDKKDEPSDVKVIVDKVTVKNVRAVVNTGVFELESLVIADFGKDTPAKIEVAGAKLVNPKGFPEPNAFTLKALNIGLETADLKKTPMVFHDIIVDSTYAGMVYNDDGVSNIDAMFKPFMGDDKGKDEKKDKKDVAKDEKKDEKKDDSPHVVIDKLDISGTKVQYRMVSLPIPLPTFTDIGKKSESGATLKEVGEQVWDKAKDAFTGVGGLVGMLGSDATNVLGNAVGFVGAGATNLLGNAAGLVTGGVSNVVSGASNVLSGAAGAINSATGGVIGGGVSNVMKGASSVIGGAAEGAKGLSEKAAEGAKDALKKLGTGGGLFGN